MKKIAILTILIGLLGIWSCGDDDEPTPAPGTKGNISGKVNLYDEGLIPLGKDSMIVSVWGSNPLVADTTDANGNFLLKDVVYGSYSLSFQKAGYGFHIINNVVHNQSSSQVNKTINLGQFSTTHINGIEAKDTLGSVIIRIATNPAGNTNKPRHIRLFFHSSDMVSYENFTDYIHIQNITVNPFEVRLNPHALEDMGFKSGQLVWVKAYGDSYYANDYIDPVKGKHIFPNLNLNSAAATSFIVP